MRSTLLGVATVVGAIATVLSASAAALHLRAARPAAPVEIAGRPQSGVEVVSVLLAASDCAASQLVGLPEAVRTINDSLAARAAREGVQFHTLAVALDIRPEKGVEFLQTMGRFDEIASGRGWFGMGSITFMLRDNMGALALPQVVLLKRSLVVDAIPSVSRDEIISRRVGAEEIAHLAANLSQIAFTEAGSDR